MLEGHATVVFNNSCFFVVKNIFLRKREHSKGMLQLLLAFFFPFFFFSTVESV